MVNWDVEGRCEVDMLDGVMEDSIGDKTIGEAPSFTRMERWVGVLGKRVTAEEGGKVREEGAERVLCKEMGSGGGGSGIHVAEPE